MKDRWNSMKHGCSCGVGHLRTAFFLGQELKRVMDTEEDRHQRKSRILVVQRDDRGSNGATWNVGNHFTQGVGDV